MLNNEVITNSLSQSITPNRELFRKISKKLKNLSKYTTVIFYTMILSATILMNIMPRRTINHYEAIYAYGNNVQIINIDDTEHANCTEHICKSDSYNAKINHTSIKTNIDININNINEFVDYVQSEISIPAYKNQNSNNVYKSMSSMNINSIKITGSKVKVSITYDETNMSKVSNSSQDKLEAKFIELAKQYGIKNLEINNKNILQSYNYIKPTTIKYNHPNKTLNKVDYIVIHSTAMRNIDDAMSFYNYWNNSKTSRGVSAHFVVDSHNVIECIPTTMKAYHCGGDNKSGINNNNSIGIEMCQTNNIEKQSQIIQNTMLLVEQLKEQYPKAEIVMHREAKCTLCPEILTDNMFEEYFQNIKSSNIY